MLVRGRLAPVAFLFEKKGLVRVALEQTDDFDAKLDNLVEAAMDGGAEDFDQGELEDGVVEIEVSSPSQDNLPVLTRQPVQVPAVISFKTYDGSHSTRLMQGANQQRIGVRCSRQARTRG